jgi:hypothetical protein
MRMTLLTLLMIVAGCSRTDKFDVSVKNETTSPLTLALTKDGPPFEQLWAAPEDLAIASPRADEQHGFVVLPPGKEADVSVEGKFEAQTRGYLRVYRGDLPISDMNAIGKASPNRLDLLLTPGPNHFVIVDADGKLASRNPAN